MAHGVFNRKRSTPGTTTTRTTSGDRAVLTARYLLAAGVVIVSGVMSYQALAELNARGHIADQWRWLWPVIFVGPEISAALAVIAAQRRQQDAAWSWFLLITATAVSVAANVWAAPPDPLSRTVHGIVPVVGFVQIKDVCNGIRRHLEATAADPVPAPVPQPVPAMPAAPPVAWNAGSLPAIITVPAYEPAALTAAPRQARTAAPRRTRKATPAATPPSVPEHHIATARALLNRNPRATGKDIGAAIEANESYGRRVKRAALAGTG